MARRNTITTVIVVLLLLALVVGLMVGLSRTLGDNENEAFSITVNGERYDHNAEGIVFGKNVTVTVPSGSYDVNINSLTVSEDFEFLIGEEVYSWTDTVYQDFTSGFNVTKNSDGFTMTYDDLASVLSDALGYPKEYIRVPDVPTDEDLFVMTVTSEDKSISLGFMIEDLGGNMSATGVSLDSSSIIF